MLMYSNIQVAIIGRRIVQPPTYASDAAAAATAGSTSLEGKGRGGTFHSAARCCPVTPVSTGCMRCDGRGEEREPRFGSCEGGWGPLGRDEGLWLPWSCVCVCVEMVECVMYVDFGEGRS